MNHFVLIIDGNETNTVFDMDTDSISTEKTPCVTLHSKRNVGEELGQSNHDYGNGGTFHALFTALKVQFCPMIFEYGMSGKRKTLKVLKMLSVH